MIGRFKEEITPDARLYLDLGVYGDDAVDLLVGYGKKFNVDVSKFMADEYFEDETYESFLEPILRVLKVPRKSHKKVLTVRDLEKGILAGRLDEDVINRDK